MKYFVHIFLVILLFGCNSGSTETEKASGCECSDLQLDPLYNHFYLVKREQPYTGECFEKNKSGIIIKTIQYKDGKVDGTLRVFYDDGSIKSETEYELNKQHGDFKVWDLEGNLTHHSVFHKGSQQEVLFHE